MHLCAYCICVEKESVESVCIAFERMRHTKRAKESSQSRQERVRTYHCLKGQRGQKGTNKGAQRGQAQNRVCSSGRKEKGERHKCLCTL